MRDINILALGLIARVLRPGACAYRTGINILALGLIARVLRPGVCAYRTGINILVHARVQTSLHLRLSHVKPHM